MGYQTGLPAALAAQGLTVELVPGWETRGAASFTPRGAVSHWTAGPRGTTGRPSLSVVIYGRKDVLGPLCNVYLARDGAAVVVAAGRANHAGAGGWRGLTGNSSVFGTEAEAAGDGDWTDAQRWAYPRINAAYCKLGAFGPEWCCGHNEWAPGRKIDIRDWDMTAMRAQVAAQLAGKPTPPPVQEDTTMAQLVLATNGKTDEVWIGDGITRRRIGSYDTLLSQQWLAARNVLGPFYAGGAVQTIPDLWALGYPIDIAIEAAQ